MSTSITFNSDGSATLYQSGKKIMRGDRVEVLRRATGDAPAPIKRERPKSRTKRWTDAAGRASAALEELQDIQQEFLDWLDNLPENLQQSAVGEKLQAIVDLDISIALDTVQEAEGADLPLGFGRD